MVKLDLHVMTVHINVSALCVFRGKKVTWILICPISIETQSMTTYENVSGLISKTIYSNLCIQPVRKIRSVSHYGRKIRFDSFQAGNVNVPKLTLVYSLSLCSRLPWSEYKYWLSSTEKPHVVVSKTNINNLVTIMHFYKSLVLAVGLIMHPWIHNITFVLHSIILYH